MMAKTKIKRLTGYVPFRRLQTQGERYRIIRDKKDLGTFIHVGRASPDPWREHYEVFIQGIEILFVPVIRKEQDELPHDPVRYANNIVADIDSSVGPRTPIFYGTEFSESVSNALERAKTLMEVVDDT